MRTTFSDQDAVQHRNIVAYAVVVSASLPFLTLAEPSVLRKVARRSHYLPFLMTMILVAFPNPSSMIAIHLPPLPFFWEIAS
jgi:hypothetical protein